MTQWITAQIGSREHYAVPRSFHLRGELDSLYTDAWLPFGAARLARGKGAWARLGHRFHPDLPDGRVFARTKVTVLDMARRRLMDRVRSPNVETRYRGYVEIGQAFGSWVVGELGRRSFEHDHHRFFAFSTGALEMLEFGKRLSILTVVDQLDPGIADEEAVVEEMARWPHWSTIDGRVPSFFFDRLRAEWELANFVLVNSDYSKSAIHRQGVPREKLIVVPLVFQPKANVVVRRAHRRGPLTVLWLGQVILRKGIPYLFEAARLLEAAKVRFVVAGSIGITEYGLRRAPANVRILGHVSRGQAEELFATSDVFLLPTLSDGFAMTQLEAMAAGLPVIATRHCGDVVEHGKNGMIIPLRDPEAIAEAVLSLDTDRGLLESMSRAAVARAMDFPLASYAENVHQAVGSR